MTTIRTTHPITVQPLVRVVAEPKIGPEPRGIRKCSICDKPIISGEAWQKTRDPEHKYTIGVHNACRARK